MSNTLKDKPWWVRQNDPSNRLGEHHTCRTSWSINRGRKCDIDEPATPTKRKYCRYELLDEKTRSKKWYDQVSKGIAHDYYWKPERAEERDALGQLLSDAQSGEEPDAQPELTQQHRHAPHAGGYWH
jgi:hypothetical protein